MKISPVITNQRLSPYRAGSLDKIQVKTQIFVDQKLKPINQSNIPINLYMNYSGDWGIVASGITNRFGYCNLNHSCEDIPSIDFCLAKFETFINGSGYISNISRINFIGEGALIADFDFEIL